ncbi:hypothetical protein I6G82_03270 [Lysinibacillus macroides]|uniref:Uncharacterized protein n=1 Tax=Lysinibacillus macroides TaxID=33935 RepID=A0A0M9DGU2_9BACI|nr:hypothetical protein [Lysinibacillus macroides]KOY81178.1 hypothetical protein ADM90_18710 [Lysinibacillus macroides]QPR68669.1 hypothetical protein I6G82_03270 [Lysinibacillus macroides]
MTKRANITPFTIDPGLCKGYYWIYHVKEMFSILIRDFYFFEDHQLDLAIPELLTVTYYESISGEELNPCQSLKPSYIRSYWEKGEKHVNPRQALTTLKATTTFSGMGILLRQIAAYRGSDLTSAFLYEGKVYEA